MKRTHAFYWLLAATLAASWPVTAGAMSGHGTGGFAGGGPHGPAQHGFNHQFGSHHNFNGHRFVVHDHFFRNHRRFFVGFDFVGFGFPNWWFPDYYYYGYYGYPYDYATYDSSPVYDYRYWYGLATAVQTELARRGYYHGSLDGVLGSGSREAIRAFQDAQGLPPTGLIDPALLKALKLPAVPRITACDSVPIFG
jgi:Putative peptidoglycan binding domain